MQPTCYHFSRKIPVRYGEHRGHTGFPRGPGEMHADDADTALHFSCTAETTEAQAREQCTINEHIQLFSRKNRLAVAWK